MYAITISLLYAYEIKTLGRRMNPAPRKKVCRCSTRDGAASADDQQGTEQSAPSMIDTSVLILRRSQNSDGCF